MTARSDICQLCLKPFVTNDWAIFAMINPNRIVIVHELCGVHLLEGAQAQVQSDVCGLCSRECAHGPEWRLSDGIARTHERCVVGLIEETAERRAGQGRLFCVA